jgi:hypothetical protein
MATRRVKSWRAACWANAGAARDLLSDASKGQPRPKVLDARGQSRARGLWRNTFLVPTLGSFRKSPAEGHPFNQPNETPREHSSSDIDHKDQKEQPPQFQVSGPAKFIKVWTSAPSAARSSNVNFTGSGISTPPNGQNDSSCPKAGMIQNQDSGAL